VKAERGKQLRLGPDDINPLDVDFDQEWESTDDPRIEVWKITCPSRTSTGYAGGGAQRS
jgi:hypothetical protein